jgi:beta-glucanase (GH16 family)
MEFDRNGLALKGGLKSMRNILGQVAAFLFFAVIAGGLPTSNAVAQIADIPGWQLAWQDEFEGNAVDDQNWHRINLRNSHNDEKQYYLPEQAAIVDGKLRITATNQPFDGKAYRSARLESWQAFAPGRFEARIDLPTTQGMWPAFWLLPNGEQWPTHGEIDILENRGSQPFVVSSAYHWQTNPGPCCDQHRYEYEEYGVFEDGEWENYHEGFHTYAVEWEATQLRFYVDDVLHYTINEASNRPIFETPMNIILNLAVGGHFGGDPNGSTVFPQVMDVEYVRVWQKQSGLSGDYNADGSVDAADYVVWRAMDGQTGIGLAADGSGNGSVGVEDLNVWAANLGGSAAAAVVNPPLVPEPATAVPMAVSLMLIYVQRFARTDKFTRAGEELESQSSAGVQ